ncbi:MAG: SLBB domain-containing protein [Pseudomonadota bacterium]|nr:SLBB domain-containing protein [Pseudomonadota bacterium]
MGLGQAAKRGLCIGLVVFLGMGSVTVMAQDSGGSGTQGGMNYVLPQLSLPHAQENGIPTITNAPAGLPAYLPGNSSLGQAPGRISSSHVSGLSSLPASPPEPPNAFQKFVQQSTGRLLPLYGYNLFSGAPSTFAPVQRIPVTANYVIGPGDELILRAWGQIDMNYHAVVDRNGSIFIPKVGNIPVAGIEYDKLGAYLKDRIGRIYRNFDLNVTMGKLRSIQVFVVGQARRPGVYTVSSLSTLVNALFDSGGPANTGSMRHIELKRDNQAVTSFDLYDLLLKGDKSKDVRLLPGDVIYIPPIGPEVAITGDVRVPAIYELSGHETLKDLLRDAGGLSATASGEKVSVERIVNRRSRKVEDLALNSQGLSQPLQDGDVIRVFSVSPKFANAVTLRGHVASPMRYPWHSGMRILDLIPNEEALLTPNYWEKQNASLTSPALHAGSGPQVQGVSHPQARGIVTQNTVGGTESFQSEVDLDSASINWDYAVIERLNPKNLTTRLIPFNLGQAVLDKNPSQNLPLRPGDIVTIFSSRDIRMPVEQQPIYVRLQGEVSQPGVFEVKPGETLRELVEKDGGLTPDAYLYGAEFTRVSSKKLQQKNMDESIARMEKELAIAQQSESQNQLSAQEAANNKAEVQSTKELIERLKQVKATGRIVLGLSPLQDSAQDLPNIPLENGDELIVPARPATINVVGAVYNPDSFIYRQGDETSHYLNLAGGPTRDADTGSIYVVHADGSVTSREQSGWVFGNFSSMKVFPGDTVIVPEKIEHTTLIKGLKDWTQILYQFGLGVAGIHVLTQ